MDLNHGNSGYGAGGRTSVLIQLLLVASITAACLVSPVTYARLTAEDYWGEYATFVAFLVAGAFFAISALVATRSTWQRRAWYWLFSGAALFVAMEEISWGQRVFSISTPEALSRINNQNELTLHNISTIENVIPYASVVSILVLGYGVLIAVASRFLSKVRRVLDRSGFVYPGLNLVPTFLVATYLLTLPFYKSEELGELFVGFGMMFLAADHLGESLAFRPQRRSALRRSIVICAGILSLWGIFGYVMVPALIESAYNGNNLELVNRMITGQNSHPLEDYTESWVRLSHLGSAFIGAGIVMFGMFFFGSQTGGGAWQPLARTLSLIGVALALGVTMSFGSGHAGSFHVLLGDLSDRAIDSGRFTQAGKLLAFMEADEVGSRRDLVYRRARLAYQSGNTAEANALAREGLALETSALDVRVVQPERWHRIGEFHAQLGDAEAAERHWNRALADYEQLLDQAMSDKVRADTYLMRAGTLTSMKSFNAALDDYFEASLHATQGIQRKRIWLGIVSTVNLCRLEAGHPPSELPAYWHSESWARVEELAVQLDGRQERLDWCSNNNPLTGS